MTADTFDESPWVFRLQMIAVVCVMALFVKDVLNDDEPDRLSRISELEIRVIALEGRVAAMEGRVAAMEAKAAEPVRVNMEGAMDFNHGGGR